MGLDEALKESTLPAHQDTVRMNQLRDTLRHARNFEPAHN